MEIWQAILLGLVQGVTEFLPISSSGHLVLVQSWLGIVGPNMLAFDVVLHVGTLTAVVLYFWRDLLTLTQTLFRKMGRLPVNEKDVTLLMALVWGTLPAAVAGFFLASYVEDNFMGPVTVAGGLILGALFFVFAEWKRFVGPAALPLSLRRGWWIGLAQMLALIPGLSRSGTTIGAGMVLGMSRYEASRFSFLLAIPITMGAAAHMLLSLIREPVSVDWTVLGVGVIVSFISALVVIHYFLSYVRRYTLWPFVWYSLALAVLVLYKEFLV